MRGATPASRLALIRGLDLPHSYFGQHFFDAQIGHLFDGPRLREAAGVDIVAEPPAEPQETVMLS